MIVQTQKRLKLLSIYQLPRTFVESGYLFLGMVNQLSKFTEYLADKTKPLGDLLSKTNSWTEVMPKTVHSEKLKNA